MSGTVTIPNEEDLGKYGLMTLDILNIYIKLFVYYRKSYFTKKSQIIGKIYNGQNYGKKTNNIRRIFEPKSKMPVMFLFYYSHTIFY